MKQLKSSMSQQNLVHRGRDQTDLASRIVEALWSEPMLADALLKNRKSWQEELAVSLDMPYGDVMRAINDIGHNTLKELASNHPSGVSPAVVAGRPTRVDYARNTDALFCNTGNSCGTCRGYCSKPANPL
jgi:hypothetical protein